MLIKVCNLTNVARGGLQMQILGLKEVLDGKFLEVQDLFRVRLLRSSLE